jgi:hypothetical protein
VPGLRAGTSAEFAASCVPGSWAGCARSQPAAFIKE